MAIDKNQAVIDFLLNCPQIRDNPVYFNFINAKDNNIQIITLANDRAIHRPYIDGSVLKRFTFTIIDFKSIAYNAVVKQEGYADENVSEMLDVQGIIDWVDEQADNKNYPDFGEGCTVESMTALTDNPNLNGVDSTIQPALAKYSISIRIEYVDTTKTIWR